MTTSKVPTTSHKFRSTFFRQIMADYVDEAAALGLSFNDAGGLRKLVLLRFDERDNGAALSFIQSLALMKSQKPRIGSWLGPMRS